MAELFCAFWNVENLFDVSGSPRRSEKLERTLGSALRGWTEDLLSRKIDQLADVILAMNGRLGPDLLGVCEVENAWVLQRLCTRLSDSGRDYRVVHADSDDPRGIDVAFIYDGTRLSAHEKFSHFVQKRYATRDIFQVNFKTQRDHLLVVLGNHWPARSAGVYESEPYRIIAAETLAYFHERIRDIHGSHVGVMAMGDFNDQPFDRSITEYALGEATRPKVTLARTPRFLNMSWPLMADGQGSFFYENRPFLFDQFLVSKGLLTGRSGLKVIDDTASVFMYPAMVSGGTYPTPLPFGDGDDHDQNGFSDHYPVTLRLKE